MTMLDPERHDWRQASDSDVYHAAQGGLPQATAELHRREAMHRVSPATAARTVARAKAGRR